MSVPKALNEVKSLLPNEPCYYTKSKYINDPLLYLLKFYLTSSLFLIQRKVHTSNDLLFLLSQLRTIRDLNTP